MWYIIDLEVIELRRKRWFRRWIYFIKGFNFVWYIDGYDKFFRYGIKIYGCIDGFLCKIIWLKVSVFNKNLNSIVYYYIESIKRYGVCLRCLRVDLGIENVYVEVI